MSTKDAEIEQLQAQLSSVQASLLKAEQKLAEKVRLFIYYPPTIFLSKLALEY